MTISYLLTETLPGKSREVYNAINTLYKGNGLINADEVSGPWDVITVLETESLWALSTEVSRIRDISGVTKVIACISHK